MGSLVLEGPLRRAWPLWPDAARRLGMGFNLGYAELTPQGGHFNTAILVRPDGVLLGKYRRTHLPDHANHEPWRPAQHLQKHYPPAPGHDHLQYFHNALSLQAGAYQNGLWAVGVAKAGREEGCDLIGGSLIVAPTGEIVAQAATCRDEVATARVDLDRCAEIRRNIFDFARHRQPAEYDLIVKADGCPTGLY